MDQEIKEIMEEDKRRFGGRWKPREDFEWRKLVENGRWRNWADKLYRQRRRQVEITSV